MRRGEVWWAEAPEFGRRPVLVLSRDAVLSALARPLIAPLTTRIRGLPTEIPLGPDDGLPEECVVSLDNVQPLSAALLVSRQAVLGPAVMDRVCRALVVATDC